MLIVIKNCHWCFKIMNKETKKNFVKNKIKIHRNKILGINIYIIALLIISTGSIWGDSLGEKSITESKTYTIGSDSIDQYFRFPILLGFEILAPDSNTETLICTFSTGFPGHNNVDSEVIHVQPGQRYVRTSGDEIIGLKRDSMSFRIDAVPVSQQITLILHFRTFKASELYYTYEYGGFGEIMLFLLFLVPISLFCLLLKKVYSSIALDLLFFGSIFSFYIINIIRNSHLLFDFKSYSFYTYIQPHIASFPPYLSYFISGVFLIICGLFWQKIAFYKEESNKIVFCPYCNQSFNQNLIHKLLKKRSQCPVCLIELFEDNLVIQKKKEDDNTQNRTKNESDPSIEILLVLFIFSLLFVLSFIF